jgi:4-oxalocrotonate tautomerase
VNGVPVVIVEMWEGRNTEQKEKIIKGITKVFEDLGIKAAAVSVVLHEVPKNNWGTAGQPASKQ